MPKHGELLVAILNNHLDFSIARDEHWYRIPVISVEKWLKEHWPPKWLAFYQTKVFGSKAHTIHYYARVLDIRMAYRWQLFADLPRDAKSMKKYFQIKIEPLRQLPKPILSRRYRRIVFIPTTWSKFIKAVEINDLYDESPLEDRLWAIFKRWKISAERQEFVKMNEQTYTLDFAIYCATGKVDIETDGDRWHANPEKAGRDNLRDNALESQGWKVLRFTTGQINEKMSNYTLPTIVKTINSLGGIDEGKNLVRRIDLNTPGSTFQYGFFDKK